MVLSEKEQEEVRMQAKQILDDFAKSLENVEVKEKPFGNKLGGFRKEGKSIKSDNDFRKITFL